MLNYNCEEQLIVKSFESGIVIYEYVFVEGADDYVKGMEYRRIEADFLVNDDKELNVFRVYYRHKYNLYDDGKNDFEAGYEDGAYWYRDNMLKNPLTESKWDTYKKAGPFIEEAISKLKAYVKKTKILICEAEQAINDDDKLFVDPEEVAMQEILQQYQ